MVYHRVGDAIRKSIGDVHPVPQKDLVEFARVGPVAPGASASVRFTLDPQVAGALTTADGSRKLYPGEHAIVFSRGNAADDVTVLIQM